MPTTVNAGQEFLLQVEVDFPPITYNNLENTRWSIIDDGATTWSDIDQNPREVRYIRDLSNGSTSNTGNHWVEIEAWDKNNANIARGKTGTSSTGAWNSLLTDGSTATSPYWSLGSGERWVQVDLGSIYNIDRLKIFHYYGDGRTYYKTKTQVSTDGIKWVTVFDSDIHGTYKETSAGHEIIL